MVVTGANRGIGLGIAECCLINGAAKVYSIDYAATGEEFASLEKQFPGKLFYLSADVTKEASITAAVDKIVEESGAIHGMVVNAGRTNHKSALDFTTEEIEGLFAVNVIRHVRIVWTMLTNFSYSVHSILPASQPAPSSSSTSKVPSSSPHPWRPIAPTKSSPPPPMALQKAASAT